MERSNRSDLDVIIGFILGFGAFYIYDISKDKKRRQELLKDINKLEKKLHPYLEEFKENLHNSEELEKALKSIDKSVGTELYSFFSDYTKKDKTVEVEEKEVRNTTNTIKKFFGVD